MTGRGGLSSLEGHGGLPSGAIATVFIPFACTIILLGIILGGGSIAGGITLLSAIAVHLLLLLKLLSNFIWSQREGLSRQEEKETQGQTADR